MERHKPQRTLRVEPAPERSSNVYFVVGIAAGAALILGVLVFGSGLDLLTGVPGGL
ncbi:MAG: hypothetical protein AAFQ51_13650 [Pseudomonadota bacterium]